MAREKPAPKYMSLSRVAEYFGMEPSTLSKLAKEHELYRPAIAHIPTKDPASRIGRKTTRYHVAQVRIIERVFLGAVDLDTAWLEWQVTRNKIIRGEHVT